MNLYIFEPYKWAYCGGAIGIIAETFDKAVETIVEADKIQAEYKAKGSKLSAYDYRQYKTKYFQATSKIFKEDHWDQWLLTNKIRMSDAHIISRILFDNWNYA